MRMTDAAQEKKGKQDRSEELILCDNENLVGNFLKNRWSYASNVGIRKPPLKYRQQMSTRNETCDRARSETGNNSLRKILV